MQPASACARRGCIPWQGILLAVSLLTFWNPQPTGQLTIEPVPVDAAEGTDVLLLVHNASENVVGYTWFKGNITDSRHQIVSYSILTQTATPGTAFSGRETIYPNGSLLFVNVTQEDTGSYTLQTTRNDFSNEVATGEFRVHVSLLTFWNPQPTAQLTIEPMPVDAAEGTDVLLLAHNASENVLGYTWFKGDMTERRHQIVSYSILTQTATPGTAFSGRETIYPNGSLLFVNVTQEDTGFYTLQTTRNDFRQPRLHLRVSSKGN
uniref:Immunoglobulin domain-containing protein n=1 Tax=Sciurus vulgaris TaxID=55149 RepID=A0A8D2DVK8_SCIVU